MAQVIYEAFFRLFYTRQALLPFTTNVRLAIFILIHFLFDEKKIKNAPTQNVLIIPSNTNEASNSSVKQICVS